MDENLFFSRKHLSKNIFRRSIEIVFCICTKFCVICLLGFGYLQAVVNNLEDAHELIDTAISTALKESKPVYISIGCNLPGIPHPTFSREPVPFAFSPR